MDPRADSRAAERAPAFHGKDAPPAALIDMCTHCGFCLHTCPTYLLWHEEMDSPRGRIRLMRGAIDGRLALSDSLVGHFDACLGCMACVTACPSGVPYGTLIEGTRAQIEGHHARGWRDRLFRAALFAVLPRPAALRLLLAPLAVLGGLVRRMRTSNARQMLPRRVAALLDLAPQVSPASLVTRVPRFTPAAGPARMRVGLLGGCVQRVVFSSVNTATVNVLSAEGCDVVSPAGQHCCGALSRHAGRLDEARDLARRTIAAFDRAGVDRVVVNAAGCGSSMKEYGELLAGDASWAERARAFSARVRDVSELLVELGPPRTPRRPLDATVAYHDACHLAHAQGIRAQPRTLLASIPGLTLVELPEAEICCGSAGIYNLVQPDAAAALGARKATHLAAARPDFVATANPGCAIQLAAACERQGFRPRVMHPVELVELSRTGGGAGYRSGATQDP